MWIESQLFLKKEERNSLRKAQTTHNTSNATIHWLKKFVSYIHEKVLYQYSIASNQKTRFMTKKVHEGLTPIK